MFGAMRPASVVPSEQRLKVERTPGCSTKICLGRFELLQNHKVVYRITNALVSASMNLEIDVYGMSRPCRSPSASKFRCQGRSIWGILAAYYSFKHFIALLMIYPDCCYQLVYTQSRVPP
jgi:hypothetical protein